MKKLDLHLSHYFGKTILVAAGFIALSGNYSADAQFLAPVATAKAEVARAAAERVIVDEDFSRFKAGSEDAPDGDNIANRMTGVIAGAWTSTPGWTGAAIYQAGGCCAVTTGKYQGDDGPYEDTGFLCTPVGDYAGDLTVTFRAKLLDGGASDDQLAVILEGPAGRIEATTCNISTSWSNYTVKFSKGLFDNCDIQFTMRQEKMLIDDIKVTSVATSLPAPEAIGATNFVSGGFTAHWTAVADADNYLVNIYERDVEGATTYTDLEELNTSDGKHIDPDNSGLPEGWSFSYNNSRGVDVSDKGYMGSKGIVFDYTNDGFTTPLYDKPIRDFSFYACHPSGVECFSYLQLSALVGNAWVALGRYDIERISKDGEILDFSSNIPAGTLQLQLSFVKNIQNDTGKDVSVVIDHIRIMTDPESKAVQTDLATTGTSLVVSGLDDYKDYSYTVCAVNSKLRSAESNNAMALGLVSPEPNAPTAVTADSYTASWSKSPKADGYIAVNYKVYTAPEDEEVTILYDNFDKVKEGTLENPVGLYNSYAPRLLDSYTQTPGWYGLANYLVNGMMGTRSFYTVQGVIQTPALNLSGAEGHFRVYLTIYGDSDAVGDSLVVQAGPKVYSRQLIDEGLVPIDMVFDFECGEEAMNLLFYTYNGCPFYIDEVTVVQYLKKGSKVYTETESHDLSGNESLSTTFTGLEAGEYESFAYRVFAYRDFCGVRSSSVSTKAMPVGESAGLSEVTSQSGMQISADGLMVVVEATTEDAIDIYATDGHKVATHKVMTGHNCFGLPTHGFYIVVGNDGSVAKVSAL